jgi:2,4-dienoyl-CoA reductase-like NADH-dependent reductase (Old Yellow Enzyme family)
MITNNLENSFTLPCGSVLPNRICKSAMSENMADKNHAPSEKLIKLYEVWAKSGAGLLVTGNVMISPNALGEPHNVVVEDEKHLPLLKRWADAAQSQGAKLWMQINHPGRQAPAAINKEVVAPSAVGLKN